MMEEDDYGYDEWLNRPSITDERNHPNHWYNRSADLHASAGALWYAMYQGNGVAESLGLGAGYSMGIACRPVYHMMCGLALEVIMKAVLVQRGIDFGKTHNLDRLVELLELQKSLEEIRLLKFYEQAINWSGRYPIPNRCTDGKLKEFWSLAADVLTSPVDLGREYGLKVYRANDADNWASFTSLWNEYASLFHHQ
jgi:hypothetical protein